MSRPIYFAMLVLACCSLAVAQDTSSAPTTPPPGQRGAEAAERRQRHQGHQRHHGRPDHESSGGEGFHADRLSRRSRQRWQVRSDAT